jgi:elongation factor Ts
MTSLENIKSLREKTGASLQACKKAIDECNGDIDLAIEHLRKVGEAKAAKRSDRDTTEGVVSSAVEGKNAVIIHIGCETDFVAKNPDFVTAADELTKKYLAEGKDYDSTEYLNELGLRMGEKVQISNIQFLEGNTIGNYVHSNRKLGSIVVLESGDEAMARDIAMHISAMNPLVTSPDEIDDNVVSKEREIWEEQLKEQGKPAEIMGKILEGKEKKFREENALLKQAFVKNPDQKIEQLLNGIKITEFVRLGE